MRYRKWIDCNFICLFSIVKLETDWEKVWKIKVLAIQTDYPGKIKYDCNNPIFVWDYTLTDE